MTYSSRGRSLSEVIAAVVFAGFLIGFVGVLCVGNYYRAKRAVERQRQRRMARKATDRIALFHSNRQNGSNSNNNGAADPYFGYHPSPDRTTPGLFGRLGLVGSSGPGGGGGTEETPGGVTANHGESIGSSSPRSHHSSGTGTSSSGSDEHLPLLHGGHHHHPPAELPRRRQQQQQPSSSNSNNGPGSDLLLQENHQPIMSV